MRVIRFSEWLNVNMCNPLGDAQPCWRNHDSHLMRLPC
jgi:hypothetical protein